jgi:hypothetical protein
MRNNTKEADGKGFPLRITAVEVKVVDNPEAGAAGEREIQFVKHMLPTLDWPALVQVRDGDQYFVEVLDGLFFFSTVLHFYFLRELLNWEFPPCLPP